MRARGVVAQAAAAAVTETFVPFPQLPERSSCVVVQLGREVRTDPARLVGTTVSVLP